MDRTENLIIGTAGSLLATIIISFITPASTQHIVFPVAAFVAGGLVTFLIISRSRQIPLVFNNKGRPSNAKGHWVGIAETTLPGSQTPARYLLAYELDYGITGRLNATSYYRSSSGKIPLDRLGGGFLHDDYAMLVFCKLEGIKAFGSILLRLSDDMTTMTGYIVGYGVEVGSKRYVANLFLERPIFSGLNGTKLFEEWERSEIGQG